MTKNRQGNKGSRRVAGVQIEERKGIVNVHMPSFCFCFFFNFKLEVYKPLD